DVCDLLVVAFGWIGLAACDWAFDNGAWPLAPGRSLWPRCEPQLLDDVLIRAIRHRLRWRTAGLIELIDVVRLRDADPLRLQRPHDVGDRATIDDTEVQQRSPRQRRALRSDRSKPEPARGVVDDLLRHVGSDMERHFGRDVAPLRDRRHAGEPAFAGERSRRHPQPREHNVAAVIDPQRAALDEGAGVRDPGAAGPEAA